MAEAMVLFPTSRPWAALLVLLAVGGAIALAGHAATGSEAATVARSLARLKSGDTAIDFRALRLAGAPSLSAKSDSRLVSHWRQATLQALEAGRVEEAATLVNAWLAQDYLNPFAQVGAQRVHAMRGNDVEAAFHHRVLEGLYDSICIVGEGLSPTHACPVVSLDEISYYLARHRYEIGDSREEFCNGSPCLVFEVRAPDGLMLIDLYFDISRVPAGRTAAR